MTIKDYITSKFQSFGIELSEADLVDISMTVSLTDEFTQDNKNDVYLAIVKNVIPQLLLRPKSISESGFSISYDNDALKNYYAWLCNELGIEDNLNDVSKISDASDIW